MLDTFTLFALRYEASDPRLGRHVLHDSRSLNYQVEAEDLSTLQSVRHNRRTPILDQGNLGSCTGNAAAGALGTDPYFSTMPPQNPLDEAEALHIYELATRLDPYPGQYPPTDTGSNGLSVAKVCTNLKLISGYLWATSLEAALTALSKGPVIVGTKWTADMFNPAADGRLIITGSVEGGHEYELDELDAENKRVWMVNSWGLTWGEQGRAYLTWGDLGSLLSDHGDCTSFVPLTQPAPTPTPPAPPAPPTPTPPAPPAPPSPDPKAAFLDAYDTFKSAADKYFASKGQ